MPSIGLLAFSRIVDDPRVRRQGDVFHAAGWQVWGVGVPGGRAENPEWPILGNEDRTITAHADASLAQAAAPAAGALRTLWRKHVPLPIKKITQPAARAAHRTRMASRYLVAQGSLDAALKAYWRFPYFRDLYERARSVRPDIWIANDWNTLPIAARLSAETGAPFGYDAHEFATSEYEERFVWRLLQKPMIARIEGGLIGGARVVSSVSPGISRALQEMYGLPSKPLTIFNAPHYQANAFRAAQEPARVLYHGVVARGRGLEETIESVASWTNGRTLTIRGPVEASYAAVLRERIARHGLAGRVTLSGPVPMTELVDQARPFDIGILALPNHSRHNAFALPNKFFEYAMAGLALCMSDLPEMSALIQKHAIGATIDQVSPRSIARAVNSMSIEQVNLYRKNALGAARELSWENSGSRMVDAYSLKPKITSRNILH